MSSKVWEVHTKRNKSPEFGKKMGLKAKAYIEKTKPDIVIACDDNASRYLVKPYYKDSTLPFVFCGVNHNAKAYGYPYKNATGMIEIAPVKPSLKIASDSVPGVKKGIYLSVDVHSQHKEYALNKKIYAKSGITLDRILVSNMEDWVKGYVRSQKLGQFVIIGSNGGLKEWDKAKAKKVTQENTRVLTITNMSWMIDYSMLAITKSANEQGEWAAKVALEILSGTKPSSIPVVSNRKWNIYVNKDLINRAKISVPYSITSKAVNVAK